jgi:hypothetical protein
MHIFKSTKIISFCYFCVAHNINNFTIKFCMLVGYTIDYIQSYLHSFLKFKSMIFNF